MPREDCIDHVIMWMEGDYLVDITEELKRPSLQRDFKKNANGLQCNDQLVAWIIGQYDLEIHLQAVDFCLVSTMSTQGNSLVFRIALNNCPLYKLKWDNCLNFAEIEGSLMVTRVTINMTIMVGDTENEVTYIKNTPSTWNEHRLLVHNKWWKTVYPYLWTF